MADIKWIKLYVDMFDNKKIKFIRKLPEGNDILLCWVMLLTSAGKCNAGGVIYLTSEIAYTPEMLADEFGMPPNTVRLALETFQKLNMINLGDEGIHISGWEEYQNIDGMERIREQNRNRKRQQREREKQKLLLEKNMSRDSHVTITQCHATDLDLDKDLEKDVCIEKNVTHTSRDTFYTGMDKSLIEEAFRRSKGKDKPELYAKAILSDWKAKGYKSCNDLKTSDTRLKTHEIFDRREYTKEELEAFYITAGKEME